MGTFNVGPIDEEFTWEGKKTACMRKESDFHIFQT